MKPSLLETLEDARVFQPTHRIEDLGLFHVPFDVLTASEATEASLRKMAERQGKLALVGPSGCGKSSVIASVLGPFSNDLAEEVVPLRIPVAPIGARVATEPVAFAGHVLETVVRYSTEILSDEERGLLARSAAGQVSTRTAERGRRLSVGAPKLLLDASFAGEVKSGAEEFVNQLAGGAAIEGLARLAEVFRARGREPFLVIDDSDRWIRAAGADLHGVADGFFQQVVPLLAREMDCGFVIALHEQYLELESYRASRQLLSRVIEVPTPSHPADAISAVIERRMELAGAPTAATELLADDALRILAEQYADGRSLRKMLQTVDGATQLGCTERVTEISPDLIQTALAELS
jgi:Cdc6-like AAA superfamily ATPase